MGIAPVRLDSTATLTLGATMVIPVFDTPPTITGFSQNAGPAAALISLSDLKTFFEGGVASEFVSTTAIATPSAYVATTFSGFASTVSGAVLMGYGTTGDVTLKNRAGTSVAWVGPNTTDFTVVAGLTTGDAVTVTGTASAPAGTVRYMGSAGGGSTSLTSNVPSGGSFIQRVAGSIATQLTASSFNLGTGGAAFSLRGTTTALTADVASGAITFDANIGTGTGAVGGILFRVPVTHGSDSSAQTLTTVLTLGATTTVFATFAGALTVTGATVLSSTLRVNGAASLGTAAGTDQTVIDGTAFGAGVASLRLNGLTTAAVNNQTATLLNAPVAGNATFWMPVSIAGVIKYIPCW
jgi:hypothetical protein